MKVKKIFNGEEISIEMRKTNTFLHRDGSICYGMQDGCTHQEYLGEYPVENAGDIPTKANHWEKLL